MNKRRVIFRADGSSEIGLGHVIRSLALVDMLKEDFNCVFAIQEPDDTLKMQIHSLCHQIIILPKYSEQNEPLIGELDPYITGSEIIVLDGYKFDTAYQLQLKNKGSQVVCIDDIYSYHFVADIVINHAVGINPENYSIAPYTELYIGPAFALLRKEFLEAAKKRSPELLKKEVLITFGGADPYNYTLQVLRKIAEQQLYKNYKINVLIGSAYKYINDLLSFITASSINVEIHKSLDAAGVVELMQRSSIAICAPSSVTIEYLCVSEGLLYLVCFANNQRKFYEYLTSRKIGYDFFDKVLLNDTDSIAKTEIRDMLDGNQQKRYRELFGSLK